MEQDQCQWRLRAGQSELFTRGGVSRFEAIRPARRRRTDCPHSVRRNCSLRPQTRALPIFSVSGKKHHGATACAKGTLGPGEQEGSCLPHPSGKWEKQPSFSAPPILEVQTSRRRSGLSLEGWSWLTSRAMKDVGNRIKWFVGAAGAVVLLQLVPVDRANPPIDLEMPAPVEVQAVLERSCYDCHSNETSWP
jgi:hypothetical protein